MSKFRVFVEGRNNPTVGYEDLALAEKEAERLCLKEDRTVFVLQEVLEVKVDKKITKNWI